jgi:transcriptional regulator with XRE-family HTH domain
MSLNLTLINQRLFDMDMTREQFAKKLGMTRANLYKVLASENISLKKIKMIAQVLHVDPKELIQ